MTEVISVKFKNRGKSYFFAPNGRTVHYGDQVIVETSKGLEIADCCHGNHMVEDSAVVPPLRPMVRLATADDIRIAQANKQREREAFEICQQKIAEHGLDMKLVDVECNFEGSKTMFFFTSDGRVDFRELVKDLAGIFRNRIELRQIGVRDEAKMLGGLGICGRPFCCSKFLDEFQPVSTKMAKIQSMSLNPSKISGSCGRLMCCLRYEQEAYEDLVKSVPKQGTFVETPAGYGSITQVNLLRQLVKVKLDGEGDDTVRTYKAEEIAVVPGGRPKDGETPPSVLKPVQQAQKEPEKDWELPKLFEDEAPAEVKKPSRNRKNKHRKSAPAQPQAAEQPAAEHEAKQPVKAKPKNRRPAQGKKPEAQAQPAPEEKKPSKQQAQPAPVKASPDKPSGNGGNRHRYNHRGHAKQKPGGSGQSGKT